MKPKMLVTAIPAIAAIALTGCLTEPKDKAREPELSSNWTGNVALIAQHPERDPSRPRSLFYEPLTDREKYGTGIDMFKRSLEGTGFGDISHVVNQLEEHDIELSEGAKSAMQASTSAGVSAVKSIQKQTVSDDGRKVLSDGLLERKKAPSKVYRNKCTADDNLIQVSWFKVIDGNTVRVHDFNDKIYKVKLQGIEAPSLQQGFGEEAKKNLHKCIAYDPTDNIIVEWRDKDKDGNIIGKISNAQFEDCGLFLLSIGLAWHDKRNEYTQYEYDRVLYSNAENSSRRRAHGLWVDRNNIAPWDYKAGKRNFTTDFQEKGFDYKDASCTLDGISTSVGS